MGDAYEYSGVAGGPNEDCLFATASEQMGYFTAVQAHKCGYSIDLIKHHLARRKFIRIRRALYRFRLYPSSPREEILAAWLALGDAAVVSHESALELHGLSDVIPSAIHLTVPRARRNLPKMPGIAVHTSSRPIATSERTVREGIPVTSPTRSIVDSTEMALAPDQIYRAIQEALQRGLTTELRLADATTGRSKRVRDIVAGAVQRARQPVGLASR